MFINRTTSPVEKMVMSFLLVPIFFFGIVVGPKIYWAINPYTRFTLTQHHTNFKVGVLRILHTITKGLRLSCLVIEGGLEVLEHSLETAVKNLKKGHKPVNYKTKAHFFYFL